MNDAVETALSVERPFPGLRPFGAADWPFFFGRTEQSEALFRMLDRGRFIAVVGSSGSGKSSLVRAGLRRLLDEESAEKGARRWFCLEMRPGSAPLAALATALASIAHDEDSAIASARRDRMEFRLRQSSFGLESAVAEIGDLGNQSVLLIVDQFEELFRFGASAGRRHERALDMRQREEATLFVQLLLEINRRRTGNIHVLLTMRSDFIGDCVRYQGLPEAVSVSQFLVPALTRDQLEDVIREPIDRAGASIEPPLVERILNDCSDEPDNLPVLQHCLLRLWERAGADRQPGEAALASTSPARRHLVLAHYQGIGGMAEALSRHADEVLSQLRLPEQDVEQVIRALAEIDREGRAIRRALPFGQLADEAGIPLDRLQRIVDRFRADDCSFLVPSPTAAPVLGSDTPIDVGHEALLRRWKKVSGEKNGTSAGEDQPCGWLHGEAEDGERYRGLVGMLDKERRAGGVLPLHRVTDYSDWWNERPRTKAWAERYGGRFESVRTALSDGVAEVAATEERRKQSELLKLVQRRRNRNIRRAIIALSVLFAIGGLTLAYIFYQQRLNIKKNYDLAVSSSQQFLDKILRSYQSGDVTLRGERALADVAEKVTNNVRSMRIDPDSTALYIDLQIVKIDLAMTTGATKEALTLSMAAKAQAGKLVRNDPNNIRVLRLLFSTTSRLGDALAARRNDDTENLDKAYNEYNQALNIVGRVGALDNQNANADNSLVETHEKISDVFFMKMNYKQALQQLESAMSIVERSAAKRVNPREWHRQFANVKFRMSGILRDCRQWPRAYAAVVTAQKTQAELLKGDIDNTFITSNYVGSRTRLGDIWKRQYRPIAAADEYKAGTDTLEKLFGKDPTNPQWQTLLAIGYVNLAEVLASLDKTEKMSEAYRKALNLRKMLLARDPASTARAALFASIADNFADSLVRPHQQGEREQWVRTALEQWERLATPSGDKAAPASRYGYQRFADHIRLSNILLQKGGWTAALGEYGKAVTVYRQFGNGSLDDWQAKLTTELSSAKRHRWKRGGIRRRRNVANEPLAC